MDFGKEGQPSNDPTVRFEKPATEKPSSESSFVRCSMFLGQLLAAGKPQQAYELGSSIGDGSVCCFRLTDPLKPVICALMRELDS